MSGPIIRLAPDVEAAVGKGAKEALGEAKEAFQRARVAQGELAGNLYLSARLADPGMVNRAKLLGMVRQAEEQVARAQAVAAALFESMEAIQRYSEPTSPTGGTP